jgi:redox-sensitive bicupin YhaK (pirin superfamily)
MGSSAARREWTDHQSNSTSLGITVKISDVTIKTFRTYADRWDAGHAQPLPKEDLRQTVLSIHGDDSVAGHYFGGGAHGDAEGLNVVDQSIILGRIRNLILGCDPLDREMKWKWLWVANIPEHVASAVDNAL